ncbi:hypothetical protein KFE25_008448 [Diacronema lutheri]|uniref:Uncharacterized protein n=1 Tax=Diacronema lutheri TaxID=2081491 RepID=A0A8J5X1W6_DIALT|nr:hypothetical protein KFE25_008448 [Diacronema lutheri]
MGVLSRAVEALYGDASSSGEEDEGARSSLPQSCPTPTDRTTLPAHADASLDAPLAYAQPDGAVQLGCEVKLNDRVDDNVLGSGVIIGLPLESYESHDERRGKALVKFDDVAQPSWRTWGHLNAMPMVASIERQRAPKRKPGSADPRPPRGPAASKSKQLNKLELAHKRLAAFPECSLVVRGDELRCTACRVEVSCAKKNHVVQHLATAKHVTAFEKLTRRAVSDQSTKDDIYAHFVQNQTADLRYRIVESFMFAGIELTKADHLRALLQRCGCASTDSSHLRTLVPMVEKHELERIRADLSGQLVNIAFDGTRRLGEAVNVTGRFCSPTFQLEMRLIAFVTVAKSLSGNEIAAMLTTILLQQLNISLANVVGFSRDSVAANGKAMQTLSALFPSSVDLPCISHTLTHVGEAFRFELLDTFMTPWYTLVCNNEMAGQLWHSTIGESVKGFSSVRWYCRAEIMMQIAQHFDKVPKLLEELREREIGEATTKKMLEIYATSLAELKVSLAAILDMRRLIATTYELEGDRLEILLAYERIEALRSLGRRVARGDAGSLPNVDALLRRGVQIVDGIKIEKNFPMHGGMCEGVVVGSSYAQTTIHHDGSERKVYKVRYPADNTEEELDEEEIRPLIMIADMQVRKKVIGSLKPGFEYLEARLTCPTSSSYLSQEYAVLKAVRIFDPSVVREMSIDASMVENLAVLRCLSRELIDRMKSEVDSYVAAAAGVEILRADVQHFTDRVLAFWRAHRRDLLAFAEAARIVFALSPNSASCERVYSLLAVMFGGNQESALADLQQGSLMLR